MKKYIPWLTAAVILVIIFGTMYAINQHAQRNQADYPQVQMAEDAAAALNQGVSPSSLTAGHVNMNTSLAPFVIIYSKNGTVISGSGYLNGSIPTPPVGILTAAANRDFHRVTWQPQTDVRIAAVTVAANNYYVLSGRSLQQVEISEAQSFLLAFLGGLTSLVVLGLAFLWYRPWAQKRASRRT